MPGCSRSRPSKHGPGNGRSKQALASFKAYHSLFEHSQGYYPGVNAATMALIAGNAARRAAIAGSSSVAVARCRRLLAARHPGGSAADLGRAAKAKTVLAKARSARGADDGAKASTILQFRRLAEVLDADIEAFVGALGARNVAVFSGHLFRGKEIDEDAQETTEAEIRRRPNLCSRRTMSASSMARSPPAPTSFSPRPRSSLGRRARRRAALRDRALHRDLGQDRRPAGQRRQMGEALPRLLD